LKPAIDFMIIYSSRRGGNYQANLREPTKLFCSLVTEYRALQELRERVRKAEAAARKGPARSQKSGRNTR
jgi:hypothetical protein